MRRMTLAEVLAPASTDRQAGARDEAERSAAIAAMGYRLAAAGPRTRQRLLDRHQAQEQFDQEDWDGYRPSDDIHDPSGFAEAPGQYSLAFDVAQPAGQRPPLSTRTIVRRSALLGVMAVCGFGFVLIGYGREGVHLHRKAARADTSEAAAQPQPAAPAAAEVPVVTATVQEASLVQPAMSETATLADPPPAAVPAQAAAAPSSHDTMAGDAAPATQDAKSAAPRPALRKPETPAAPKPAARQTALADAAPPPRTHGHPPVLRETPVLFRPAELKPRVAHPVVTARIELPRWLTEDHPEHPRVALVMSEPPHDLVAPAAPRHLAAAQPASAEPPAPPQAPREPDTITASSADVAPPRYRPPPLRPGYGAPYPGYGPYYPPYGGYYGAAMAYAAPYPAPPGYGYRW